MSRNAEKRLNQKTINMETFESFYRTTAYGTAKDITLKGQPTDSSIKILDGLLSDGKIIAYGYTTLLPY